MKKKVDKKQRNPVTRLSVHFNNERKLTQRTASWLTPLCMFHEEEERQLIVALLGRDSNLQSSD